MTDLWVRNVRTNKPREEWRDAKQPNLELRVTEKGAKTWRLHYTRADERRKATRLARCSSDGIWTKLFASPEEGARGQS